MLTRTTLVLGASALLGACQPADVPDSDLAPSTNMGLPTPKPRASAKPSGIPATAGTIVQAGDSIGLGNGAEGNWAAIDHLGLPKAIKIHNVSINGYRMLFGLGRRETDVLPFYDPKHTSVLVIQQGTNDLVAGGTADYLYNAVLKPFVSSAQAAGFYVVADTILPRGDPGWTANPALEHERQAYNQLVRSNRIGADAINDLAADREIGDTINPQTSLLYFDALHLRKEGQERIAKIETRMIATLLEYPPREPSPR